MGKCGDIYCLWRWYTQVPPPCFKGLSEDSAVVPGNIPGHLFVSPLHAVSSRILESFQDSEVNVPISYHQFWVIWH